MIGSAKKIVEDDKKNNAAGSPHVGKGSGMGARLGNRHGLRHGLQSGRLPKGCKYIEVRLNCFRRQLEDAVIAVKGELGILDSANIQTAIRWERHGMLAQRWLRLQADELKPVEQLTFSREIARASTERDRALALLGLDLKPEPIDLRTYIAKSKNGTALVESSRAGHQVESAQASRPGQ
jgi:hypothetical protein